MARNAQVHTPYSGGNQSAPTGVTIINNRDANPPPKPPPPSYSDSYTAAPYTTEPPKNTPGFTGNVGWDTSYLQSSTTDLHAPYNSEKPGAPASNPFQ